MKKLAIILLLLALILPALAFTITWTPAPGSETFDYKVFIAGPTNFVTITATNRVTISNAPPGQYSVYVIARSPELLESAPSVIVNFTNPAPPISITVGP